MSDFSETWSLVRGRFVNAIKDLGHSQISWRMHPDVLTIGEMAVHVAGVEISFISQLAGVQLTQHDVRLKSAATDGVVNDKPFPYSADEITPSFLLESLGRAEAMVKPIIENMTPELRSREIVSALGPVIDGTGAMARLAYHPGYHQGQVHMIVTAPGFPK